MRVRVPEALSALSLFSFDQELNVMEKVVTDKRQVTHFNQIEKIYIQHGFDKTRKLEKWKKRRAPSRRGRDIVRVLETKKCVSHQ